MVLHRGRKGETQCAILKYLIEKQEPSKSSLLFEQVSAQFRKTNERILKNKRSFNRHLFFLIKQGILEHPGNKYLYSLPQKYGVSCWPGGPGWCSKEYLELVFKHVLSKKTELITDLKVDESSSLPNYYSLGILRETLLARNRHISDLNREEHEHRREQHRKDYSKIQWNALIEKFYIEKQYPNYEKHSKKYEFQVATEKIAHNLLEHIVVLESVKKMGGIMREDLKVNLASDRAKAQKLLSENKLSKKQSGIIEHLLRVLDALSSKGSINTLDLRHDWKTQNEIVKSTQKSA